MKKRDLKGKPVTEWTAKELNDAMKEAYKKAVIKNYGSMENYEKYLFEMDKFLESLPSIDELSP